MEKKYDIKKLKDFLHDANYMYGEYAVNYDYAVYNEMGNEITKKKFPFSMGNWKISCCRIHILVCPLFLWFNVNVALQRAKAPIKFAAK